MKLFAESIKIDEERSVLVLELADSSIAIRGLTTQPNGEVTTGAVRLSAEAAEIARQLLNEWHECNKGAP